MRSIHGNPYIDDARGAAGTWDNVCLYEMNRVQEAKRIIFDYCSGCQFVFFSICYVVFSGSTQVSLILYIRRARVVDPRIKLDGPRRFMTIE